MSDKETGGPAFPSSWDAGEDGKVHAFGMSLRDYFAAKALTGLLAANQRDTVRFINETDMARSAYALADAMLKARGA